MVLIGCKTDLRKDKEQLRKLRAAQLEPITYMQVRKGSPLLLPHLVLITPRHGLLASPVLQGRN